MAEVTAEVNEAIVGVLSDTHGRHAAAAAGVAALRARGASWLLHTGDVGTGPAGRRVIDELAAARHAGLAVALVWGNTDHDGPELAQEARAQGIDVLGRGGVVEVGGKRIALAHGHEPAVWADLQPADYALSGHTHVPHDFRERGVRWLNPGALFRTSRKTVGVLDVAADAWELVDVETD